LDEAFERIQEDALSVRYFGERVDGVWSIDKVEILVTTGGPAVRVMCDIDDNEPVNCWLEVQDWGKPWSQYYCDRDVLLQYCETILGGMIE
jgi:hypothetical protein